MRISTLSESECKVVLADHNLAHLACTNNWRPYVVPIHYVYADGAIYAFSLPGKKIEWMRYNPLVCLMVEEKQQGRAWKSVVVDGLYEELRDGIGRKHDEREHAWSLLSKNANWWEPGALKPETSPASDQPPPVFFRIVIEGISGRQAKE